MTRDDSWNYADVLWNGIQAKAVTAAFEQLSYKEQWYLEKRNAICMTCGRVSPLSTQSTFEDLAVDFEGTTASGAERFYRRTLDKLRLKLLESGLIHTVTLKQTECRKRNKIIAAAVYLYQADNGGEWGELRFDFESGTAEIVRLADWDTTTSNIFAKTAIRFVQGLPEARLLNSVVVPFEMDVLERPLPLTKAAKESNGNSSHTISLRQTERWKTGETITAAVYEYLVDNDGEWGNLRFDFESGTAEIVKLADWDTIRSNIFANTAIRFVQGLPEARLLKSVVVPFEMGVPERPRPLTKAAKESNGNSSHTISLRQTECRKTGETITAAVYEYLVDNDGEWGELRFDFENGTAEIIRLADWDTVKSKVFAKAAIRFAQGLPEARLPKFVVVPLR